MKYDNEMRIEFVSKPISESFIQTIIEAFILELDPTMEELTDIKTSVVEAVDNAIEHAYVDDIGKIILKANIIDRTLTIEVTDTGKGIDDIEKAKVPLHSTKKDASGMGFTIMENFMDKVTVSSEVGKGTTIIMQKTF